MSWNYRVVKKVDISGEDYYEFVEAYYEKGKINGYADTGIFAEDPAGLAWILNKLKESTEKEVLTPENILGSE